ncbi:MAG: DNA/RNA non-specific endonuclease [Gemmataceae bacterium]|nr:DNA/RNA non-specific endonuclease [Gemmata sp.]MDW8197079.1 DNA/RNA non-specific endonuclease [Gemmataceae bacterium]
MAVKSPFNPLSPQQRWIAALLLLLVLGVLALLSRWAPRPEVTTEPQPTPSPADHLANRNIRYGMPGPAQADPASREAFLIAREQYVLSYNDTKKIPNWVSWHLTQSDIGKTDREPGFLPDPALPPEFYAVKQADYNNSGFDRGHMCPSKDRSDTRENNRATFYMTNIVPQSPACNQRAWAQLENDCRRLAQKGNELYIACGPHGEGGTGLDGFKTALTLSRNNAITVPNAVWKVVMILPNSDAQPTAETRTLAAWMPNDQSVQNNWKRYLVTVAEVEEKTGLKFFPLLPDEIAHPIKNRLYTER